MNANYFYANTLRQLMQFPLKPTAKVSRRCAAENAFSGWERTREFFKRQTALRSFLRISDPGVNRTGEALTSNG
jgi:hypothetical protein